jgi:emfourin
MRITLTRHGGLLPGMKRPPLVIDDTSLDAARADRLRTLVARAIGAQQDRAEVRAMPDAISYSIAIDDDGRVTTLKQTEPTDSSPFADLLEFLERLS